MCVSALVSKWATGWISFTSVAMVRLVVSRVCMEVFRVSIDSDMWSMCLDCSTVVALIKLHSRSILLVVTLLSVSSFSEIAAIISVDVSLLVLCLIRNPTAFSVDAVGSVSFCSRAIEKRMFASVSAV